MAVQNAYEMAKAGGRHAGLLRTYQGKSTVEIQRALRGYARQVDLHRQKLRSPEQFVKDWATHSARMQEGLRRHWRDDLARNQELTEIMQGILQDRGIQP